VKSSTIRSIAAAAVALLAVGGGIAFALIAQSQGHSPEPPAWLSLLIGGAATYFYAQSANLNGSAAALDHFAAAVTAHRSTDPAATGAEIVARVSDTSAAPATPGAAGGTSPQGS